MLRTQLYEINSWYVFHLHALLQLYTVVNLNIDVIFFVIVLQKCLEFTCLSKAYLCILVTSLGLMLYLYFFIGANLVLW
jgi:hypothetical protein